MSDKTLISLFNCDDGSWESYDQTAAFLSFISPMEGQELNAGNTKVFSKPLPFYNDVKILQVTSVAWEEEPTYYFFLQHGDDYILLRGLSDVIHELNETGAINLSKDNVMDYLKFFCLFTKNEEGECYYIIEGQNSEFLAELSGYDKSRHLRKYQGLEVSDFDNLGRCIIKTRVLNEGHVYDATFEVLKTGNVEMKDDVMIGSV
tara:strand:- start:1319 stop:1930 length:612 start_codon:yes stop_codon:yes gene_type:complete